MRVVIAGGGIGGLTAALACLRFGLEPVVLERSPVLTEVGAGIQLSPNAMHVLTALGLDAGLRQTGVEPEALEMRLGDSGRLVVSIPAGPAMQQRHGAPYLHVHRQDLVAALSRLLEMRAPGALQTGGTVTGIRADPAGVEVTLDTGLQIPGDVLVGADGIRSTVRAHLLPQARARFTGQVAWRAVLPLTGLPEALTRPRATVWVGPGRHLVTYLVRSGTALNVVAVEEQPGWEIESWTEPGDPAQLQAAFAGFCAPVRQALARVGPCHRWALHDRAPLERWVRGRIGLLGDACHPMLPFQAQGAAMAVEDAWVLARSLRDLGPQDGLEAYAARRLPRTARVQAAARANAGLFHRRSALARALTYGPMAIASRLLPGLIASRQDWIYGHNVVAGAQ